MSSKVINKTSKVIIIEEIPKNLIIKLQEQQKTGDLCDFKLKTKDGGNFNVHKWVLCSVSSFFTALFSNNNKFGKSNLNYLLLHNVSENVLDKVIGFIYTGIVEINFDIVKEVINIALFLNLNTLIDDCLKILTETLNEENCMELLEFSETCVHYGKELTEKSLKLVCKNFKAFVESSDFCELSSITMKILVNQSRTEFAYNEGDLYLAVVKWISFDVENRKCFANELIDKINFKDLDNDFAKSLLKSLSYKDSFFNCLSNKPSTSTLRQNNLYIFADYNLLSYDKSNSEFSRIITKMKEKRKFYGCTTFGKDNVFICGGYMGSDVVNTCKFFSMDNRCWIDLPSMETARSSPSSIAIDDKIYVCGGLSKNPDYNLMTTVELFDINMSVWSRECSLKLFNKFINYCHPSSICQLNKCIYFIHQNCVQRLDPKVNRGEIICEPEEDDCFQSVEAYNNYIYGFDDNAISIFDIRTNKWMENKNKYKQRYDSMPLTCVMNNCIYVLGNLDQNEHDNICLQSFLLSNLSFSQSHILDTFDETFWALFSI